MNKEYELVVGLEVHIQLNTKSKMFCGCSNNADDSHPNSVACPVCFGMPGTLPTANKEAIRKTLLLGLALGSKLNDKWNFERKNYFYPDLPKGYQITSSSTPPVISGELKVKDAGDSSEFSVGIHHVHLEEDAGKLIHGNDGYSYVDLNRAGTPLVELVTLPDIHSSRHVKLFLRQIQLLVRTLGISEADMESGHLRCDANVSVHIKNEPLGTKVEIKNINSFSMLEKAVEYEQKRQIDLLERDQAVAQETRGWNDAKGITTGHRTKEDLQDYRYLPEPDLPPIIRNDVPEFSDENLKKSLPELPDDKLVRVISEYGLTEAQAGQMIKDKKFGWYVDQVLATDGPGFRDAAKKVLFGDFHRISTEMNVDYEKTPLSPEKLAQVIDKIVCGEVTSQSLKQSLPKLLDGGLSVEDLFRNGQLSGSIDLGEVIKLVLENNSKVVEQWKGGNEKVFGFLVGQAMAATKGQANPAAVNQKLQEALELLKR